MIVLWIGAFSALVWGMAVLFGFGRRLSGQAEPHPPPRDPDVTLDEPGP